MERGLRRGGCGAGLGASQRRTASLWSFRFSRFRKVVWVSKVNPGEFIRQVRAETTKVVWPSRKETVTTAVMVVIMTLLLGVFFFGIDTVFSQIVKFLLSLAS